MAEFPVDQKIPKQGKKKKLNAPHEKTPRAKFQDVTQKTSEGDLGIKKVYGSDIPRMVKAPTRTGDSIRNHVGAVGNAMSKAGFKL